MEGVILVQFGDFSLGKLGVELGDFSFGSARSRAQRLLLIGLARSRAWLEFTYTVSVSFLLFY